MLTGWGERRPFHLITETQRHRERPADVNATSTERATGRSRTQNVRRFDGGAAKRRSPSGLLRRPAPSNRLGPALCPCASLATNRVVREPSRPATQAIALCG